MSKWIFLSYPLNDKAFGYGNGERFKLNQLRSISKGDTSNNTSFQMPSHYGTHIDFPYHFCAEGKTINHYSADSFIYTCPAIIEINSTEVTNYLISNKQLIKITTLSKNTDFLIIKTGFGNKRYTNEYWEFGLGLHQETAFFIKQHLPNIKAIGFDLISLNSYQQREHGRQAHKAFLCEQDILIVEEMFLDNINANTKLNELIVSPLLIDGTDGSPATIFGKLAY